MSRSEKMEMRCWFWSQDLKTTKERWEASRTLRTSETSRGRWLPFKRIAVELGNDLEGALEYCKSCMRMGPSQCMVDVRVSRT